MRKRGNYYYYYVEGECEQSLLNALKSNLKCIEMGRVETFNVVQNKFTIARVRPLQPGAIIVFIYDTDTQTSSNILKENIKFLKERPEIKEVICIPQVKNLEDELKRACSIKNITELTKSSSNSDFKKDLIKCTNLGARLSSCKFDISKMWDKIPGNEFAQFGNDAKKIKL